MRCHSNCLDESCKCSTKCENCDLYFDESMDLREKSRACTKRQEVIYGFTPIPEIKSKPKCEICVRLMLGGKCNHIKKESE